MLNSRRHLYFTNFISAGDNLVIFIEIWCQNLSFAKSHTLITKAKSLGI